MANTSAREETSVHHVDQFIETQRNHRCRPRRPTSTPAFSGPTHAGLVGLRSAFTLCICFVPHSELIQSITAALSSGFHLMERQQPHSCHRKLLVLVTKVWNPGTAIRMMCVMNAANWTVRCLDMMQPWNNQMKPTNCISPQPASQAEWALARHLVLLWFRLLGQPIEQQSTLP